MFTRLAINHFKSIEHAEVDLGAVNVFVGTNGSGKTNVVDGIRFIKDAITNGLDRAISDRHGISSVRQWSPTRPFRISLAVHICDKEFAGKYGFSLDSANDQFKVVKEEAEFIERGEIENFIDEESNENGTDERLVYETLSKLSRGLDGKVAIRRWTKYLPESEGKVIEFGKFDHLSAEPESNEFKIDQPDELALTLRPAWQLGDLRRRLANFQSYAIYPNTLRVPQEPSNETYLVPEGKNLASVFKRMRKTRRGLEAIAQITEAMKLILPSLDRISVLSVGGFLVPQFHIVEPSGKKHIFNVSQMSDGTLRVLGILTALYQEPRPAVIALEEPEQTVNPGILAVLADSIREVSKTSQILVTTHSPQLLDQFDPSFVRAVEFSHGRTTVGGVTETQMEVARERLFSLGELLVSEGVFHDS